MAGGRSGSCRGVSRSAPACCGFLERLNHLHGVPGYSSGQLDHSSKHMPLREKLLRFENFFWAWEKAKASYSFDRTWYDEVELARFEADLKRNLTQIRAAFEAGRYQLAAARPIAFPKRGDPPDVSPTTRQMFWFSVRDQVAWIALVNVIGPVIDWA